MLANVATLTTCPTVEIDLHDSNLSKFCRMLPIRDIYFVSVHGSDLQPLFCDVSIRSSRKVVIR